MLKKIMCIFIVLGLAIGCLPVYAAEGLATFKDIITHWGKADIEFVASKGIILGYGNGNFGPNDQITARHYIIMLVKTLGRMGLTTFDQYLDAAKGFNLITDGEFADFNAPLKRGDMARLTIKAYEYLYPATSYPEYLEAYKGLVTDYDALSSKELKNNVLKCVEQGLILGGPDGTYRPEDTSTRAQAAVIIHKILNPVKRNESKPVFAIPDPEFEAFMNNYALSSEVCSMLRIDRVVDGRIIWSSKSREDGFESGSYGAALLPTNYNKTANKDAYNVLKALVKEARKNNNYVVACFNDNGWDRIAYFAFYKSKGAGRIENGQYAFNVVINTKPKKYYEGNYTSYDFKTKYLVQKDMTYYEWTLGGLFDNEDALTKDLVQLKGQTDEYKIPLQASFKAIYGDKSGQAIFNHAINEYIKEFDMGIQQKEYYNESVITVENVEVQNINGDSGVSFGTGKQK